jgi:polysaccharide biosynthesis protein PslG
MLGTRPFLLVCLLASIAVGTLASEDAGAVPNKFFGVTTTGSPSASEFQRVARGGVKTVRRVFYWRSIEPSEGSYSWAAIDSIVAGAAEARISLLPVVFGTPLWASSAAPGPTNLAENRPPIYSQRSRTAWSTFIGALALRYGSNGTFWALHPELPRMPISTWQIWNEVNLPFYWGGRPSPRGYADLIKITHRAVRAADPAAKLVLAGLLPYKSVGGGLISGAYLKRMFKVHGIRKAFDVVAIHPYAAHSRATLRLLNQARSVLNSLGARRLPIWATEFGWTTGGVDFASSPFRTSLRQQAHRLKRSYRLIERNAKHLHLQRAFYFNLADFDPQHSGSWQTRMGLFDLNGQPKPAWYAYTRLAGGQP